MAPKTDGAPVSKQLSCAHGPYIWITVTRSAPPNTATHHHLSRRYAPSQWEMTLHCNVVWHWSSAYPEWTLLYPSFTALFPVGASICVYIHYVSCARVQLSGRAIGTSSTERDQSKRDMKSICEDRALSSCMGASCCIKNKIRYVLSWLTVYVLTRVSFLCLCL